MTSRYTRTKLFISIAIWLVVMPPNAFANSESINEQNTTQISVEVAEITTLLDSANNSNNSADKLKLCQQAIRRLKPNIEQSIAFTSYKKAGIILYDDEQYPAAKEYLTKASELSTTDLDQNKIAIVEDHLGWIASKNLDYDTGIYHFNNALRIYKTLNRPEKKGNTLNSLGAMHWYKRDYASALEYFERVLTIGEKIDNDELIRKSLTNKGVVLNNLAQYNEALICLEKALELNQFDNNKKGKAILLITLGNINAELLLFEESINNVRAALKIYEELNNNNGISACYNNLGEAYLRLGEHQKALDNYQTSLNIREEEGDSANIALSYINIGHAHQKRKDLTQAISYYEKALKLLLSFDDPSLRTEAYLRLGQSLLIQKDYKQAKLYLDKAEKLAKSLNEKVLLSQCYNSLSDWHKKQQTYKAALEYKTLYITLKDEIADQQARQSSARLEVVYKLLHKEEQISILEQDNINKSASLQDAESTTAIYIITCIALLVIVIILILTYQTRRRAEQLLTLKNKELKQLNATKDKFFSIIAHDLKSPFSSLMGFAEMLTLNAESKNSKQVIEYSHIIHNSTKRLLGLVENLLQWSRTQIGTTEFEPSEIDISIQTHNIVSLLSLTAEEKDIVISAKIERHLMAWADNNLYNTILRNLLNNAIKFSRVGSVIQVSATTKKDMIEISVADSGIGIRQEHLEKLFMVDSNFSTTGTFNEKGTGLGLALCKEFVEINKGEIWAESELEKGSTFYFTLPLSSTKEKMKP